MKVTALFGLLVLCSSPSFAAENYQYRVTVKNVTADNRISPFLVAVKTKGAEVFQVGKPSSLGIQQIAETGGTDSLEAELLQAPSTIAVAKAAGSPIVPGETRELIVSIDREAVYAGAELNLVAMIGRSNDSFTAVRGLSLKSLGAGKKAHGFSVNFDAGTEENSGNREDFGPGGHPIEFAEGLISHDRGLNLRGNAPESWAWGQNVGYFVVEKI